MEDEDFKVIEYKNRTFKCFRDGRCFVLSQKNQFLPFLWIECNKIEKVNPTLFYYRFEHILVHRLMGYCFLGLDINNPSSMIDHINHNGLDNRFENLRVVDNAINGRNRRNIKGYAITPNGKYRGHIIYNDIKETKTFNTKEEALEWRNKKELEYGFLTKAVCSP